MNSVLQSEKECFVCGTNLNLHSHHIFFGTANRKLSEKYGMKGDIQAGANIAGFLKVADAMLWQGIC